MISSLSQPEEWKEIPNTAGMYEASTHGNIRSWALRGRPSTVRSLNPKLLIGEISNRGYRRVILRIGGKVYNKSVHSLVLETFAGPRPFGREGSHDDGVKTHNWLSNLFWKTRRDNHADKWRHGTPQCGSRGSRAKLSDDQAISVKRLSSAGVRSAEISRRLSLPFHAVNHIVSGRSWKHLKLPILDCSLDSKPAPADTNNPTPTPEETRKSNRDQLTVAEQGCEVSKRLKPRAVDDLAPTISEAKGLDQNPAVDADAPDCSLDSKGGVA